MNSLWYLGALLQIVAAANSLDDYRRSHRRYDLGMGIFAMSGIGICFRLAWQ